MNNVQSKLKEEKEDKEKSQDLRVSEKQEERWCTYLSLLRFRVIHRRLLETRERNFLNRRLVVAQSFVVTVSQSSRGDAQEKNAHKKRINAEQFSSEYVAPEFHCGWVLHNVVSKVHVLIHTRWILCRHLFLYKTE